MKKDLKILIATLIFSVVLIVGFAALFGGKEEEEVIVAGQKVEGIEVNPGFFDLGDVPINGGLVTKEYEIKNSTSNTLRLKKITTSCMCTKASFEIGETKTKFFGMEGHGDKNPPVNIEISGGQTGKVVVQFDPAAHGPQGTGLFDRSIFLTFSDPAGVKELKFNGTVVK
ncbi:hypothetical protein A2715_00660 [Candidatus Woesebacteria bacterium RIFCSPHIGHO2_01_FULL_39_32]|uniref:DUF1573 domain-containing protein n=1 Tax=Candidatus Woesebacteria bacterium RIFCSPLOWO2_01_FULL_39_25 TaxID=1802521 RepID=A0A1F8BI67_9BACT|nr:MAG: hypothetical protein A2124_03460 [Candidatus Woesebacteria bacterium GWB1_37_5]OGM24426.1 MAG: hypothetical protein A2715_00660 [Candidatus Woesebacteria bacterium RIFCSPHIGHO2_01_FULL_39_32]OGM63733.1 MAG: hypothetical protein A2893_02000 [Candidatus Woesebacteria bacterium RIFCSPLOWO2_01_FULL_39_25]